MAWSGERRDRTGSGNMVAGAILIGLGVLLLLGQTLNIDLGHYLWPLFILVPGLAFFLGMLLGGRSTAGLAIPGSVITTIGLILLYQNTFNQFQTWAYAWALIPTAVGLGLVVQGFWSEQPRLIDSGRNLARIGLVLFVAFGAFFELLLNLSGFGLRSQWTWPLLLIALGVFLLMGRSRSAPSRVSQLPIQKATPPTDVTTQVEASADSAGGKETAASSIDSNEGRSE